MRLSLRLFGGSRRCEQYRTISGRLRSDFVQIHLTEVPQYLRTGQLFQNFCEIENEAQGRRNSGNKWKRLSTVSIEQAEDTIGVSKFRLKSDAAIATVLDLQQLLESLRFWGCTEVPQEVFRFALAVCQIECPLAAVTSATISIRKIASAAEVIEVLTEYENQFECIGTLKRVMMAPTLPAALEICAERGLLVGMQCILEGETRLNMQNRSLLGRLRHVLLEGLLARAPSSVQSQCPDLCERAALYGHLECLRYAHAVHGFPVTAATCAAAAESGSVPCLQYCHQHSIDGWDERVCIAAASGGHESCLRYAHENGCSWNERVSLAAALNGHVNCLRYAQEHGCQWRRRAGLRLGKGRAPIQLLGRNSSTAAADNGHLQCLNYMYEHGLI